MSTTSSSTPAAPEPSDADRHANELQAAALVELERRKREFPLYFFRPSSKLRDFFTSRCLLRQICGGNRTGKTESNSEEIASYALGYRPWVLRELGLPAPEKPWIRPTNLPDAAICFNGAGIRVATPSTGLAFSGLSLKKGIGEILAPKLKQYLAPFIAKEWMGHAGTPTAWKLKNDTMIQFGSDEQDRMSHEGTAYDWIGVDEPIKKSTYTALRRGSIDRFAPMWFSYTPIGANAPWMFRSLYTKADEKRIFQRTVSIYDNEFLSREAIEEFVNDPAISEAEKEARVHGRFQALIDRIYPQFDVDVHVVPGFTPPSDWVIGCVIDPHTVKPWFIAYFALSPRGEIYFFKEWPPVDWSTIRRDPRTFDEYAKLLRTLEGDRPATFRLIDPNYGPRADIVRGVPVESVVSQLSKYELIFYHHLNDDLEFGEQRVRQLLSYDTTRGLDSLNRPKLFITEDCPNLISGLSFYAPKARPATDNLPDESRRDETWKDPADVIRYVAVSGIAESALADSFGSFSDSDLSPEPSSSHGSLYGD